MATEFKLPNLGENIDSGDVVKVLVSVGDQVKTQQPVLEIETDKAVIEVPSSISGTVKKIHIGEGERAEVGQLILTIDENGAGRAAAGAKKAKTRPAKSEAKETKKAESRPPGAGPSEGQAPQAKEPEEAAARTRKAREPGAKSRGEVVDFTTSRRAAAADEAPQQAVPAAPSVRRLAREIGVEISQVRGTGPHGRISEEDVKSFSRRLNAVPGAGGATLLPAAPLPDFSRWGEVEREPFTNVRRLTAQRMAAAWTGVPHVTQHDRADITELEEARKRYAAKVEATGGKLTVTAILLKVLAAAVKVFPKFSASIDVANQEVVLKKYCHIGVAVDTPRGLLVPVIRDVDRKNVSELSVELTELAERARKGKIDPEDLQGGIITITNLGGIGGTSFTPIVNAPEVAILGVSRASHEAIYDGTGFKPRLVLPLSLSYDHRLIDGADAARFLRWVARALEDPFLIWLEG